MPERVSSEDPSIRTFRARIQRAGGTSRPQLQLPPEASEHVPAEVVRIVLDGSQFHADVRSGTDAPVIRGVYDTARLAQSPGLGENRLPGWLDDAGMPVGRSVLFDVVVPEFLYGIRAPGSTTVYEATEPPASSLANIAESLDE